MQALLAVVVTAHVGGIPTQARFSTPDGVGMIGDQSFDVRWVDGDMDPTGKFDFYYQSSNVPPLAPLAHPAFQGVSIPEAQDVSIMDLANVFSWNTSSIPSGSYYVYEITDDPPLAPLYGISMGPVTVRHAGDPLFPAVVVVQPDGIGDIVQTVFAVEWLASGASPLTARLSYGVPDRDDPLVLLDDDVPMLDRGDGTWEGCWLWDLSSMPQGYYYLFIEVTDRAGNSHASYSQASLVVYRDTSAPDAGAAPMCAPIGPDAGPSGNDDPGPGFCGCRVAPARRGSPIAILAFTIAVAFAGAAARRRRARG